MDEFTIPAARALSTPALLDAMRSGFQMAEEGIRRACIAIVVLEERGVALPMLPDVYRYALDIAEGRLSPRAVLVLGKFRGAIKAVMRLPIALQDEIAEGKKVKVAVKVDGRIQSRELTIFQMMELQMRLAFGEDGITPWEEQGSFLLKAAPSIVGESAQDAKHEKPTIRVAAETREIIVNRTHLTVEDLIPALSALGYVIKPVYGQTGIKPVKVS